MNNQEFIKHLATFSTDIVVSYKVCLGCFSTDNKGLYILPEPIMDASILYHGKVYIEEFSELIKCPYGILYKVKISAKNKSQTSVKKYK